MTDDRPSFAAISGKGLPPLPIVTFLRARLDEEEARVRGWYRIEGVRQHIGSFRPSVHLAEVQAKRELVRVYTADQADVPLEIQYLDDDAWVLLEWVLKQLALPYADHEDYRQEWKP
jgi:hypothetical protein